MRPLNGSFKVSKPSFFRQAGLGEIGDLAVWDRRIAVEPCRAPFGLAEFRQHLMSHLPPYARPLFLRIRKNMDLTGTFKYSKTDLVNDGFNPVACKDAVYFDDLQSGALIRLDRELYDRIQKGGIRI